MRDHFPGNSGNPDREPSIDTQNPSPKFKVTRLKMPAKALFPGSLPGKELVTTSTQPYGGELRLDIIARELDVKRKMEKARLLLAKSCLYDDQPRLISAIYLLELIQKYNCHDFVFTNSEQTIGVFSKSTDHARIKKVGVLRTGESVLLPEVIRRHSQSPSNTNVLLGSSDHAVRIKDIAEALLFEGKLDVIPKGLADRLCITGLKNKRDM